MFVAMIETKKRKNKDANPGWALFGPFPDRATGAAVLRTYAPKGKTFPGTILPVNDPALLAAVAAGTFDSEAN